MQSVFPPNTALELLLRHPIAFARTYHAALLVLAVGAILDAATTFANIARYGPHVELHPAQRILFHLLGAAGVPLAKLIQLAFVIVLAACWKPWCPWILSVCGLLYTLAAISNHWGWL
jgi:hypothetical protein